jgi:lysophospholipase L1-like esterase
MEGFTTVAIPHRRRLIAALTVLTAAAALLAGAGPSLAGASSGARTRWVGTWATALTPASLTNAAGSLTGFTDQSVRMIVRTSVGGDRLRLRLSNAYGTQALTVGHVTVGLPVAPGSADLQPGSIRELTFSGSESGTAYKGADLLSDPIRMAVPPLTELAVTVYLPAATGPTTYHQVARQNSFVYAGDRAEDPSGAGPTVTRSAFYFLAGVDVTSRSANGTVVVLGDSLSDGNGSTLGANRRWPDFLATRIVNTRPDARDPGVLNEALAGNRVTHDGTELNFTSIGNSALARLDTDVYGQTGVRTLIVQVGVNDINLSSDPAERVIGGLRQLAEQARGKDLRVLVCTIGPFEGFTGPPAWSPEKEAVRLAVNAYIRAQHDFDAVIDLDAVLRDPAQPSRLRADLDSGDHIHPNDAGAEALAAAVPLRHL